MKPEAFIVCYLRIRTPGGGRTKYTNLFEESAISTTTTTTRSIIDGEPFVIFFCFFLFVALGSSTCSRTKHSTVRRSVLPVLVFANKTHESGISSCAFVSLSSCFSLLVSCVCRRLPIASKFGGSELQAFDKTRVTAVALRFVIISGHLCAAAGR